MRAVALLSGGLDSILAVKVILDQGVDVMALNFVSVFCTCTPKSSCCSAAQSAVRQLGIELKVENSSNEFLDIIKSPKHGYGRNLNPCLDCRILMFRRAKRFMVESGASFLVTGEVLGERPMSQRREAMQLIDREAGVEGLVVRPLSAALLEPSIPEREGWIDRTKLLAIRGRSRKPQIELAEKYGISDYPCPAGGCLLTDAGFAARMRDLMRHEPDFTLNDVQLLKLGRHFRLSPAAKAIVGRNEEENKKLLTLARDQDILLEAVDLLGPVTLLRGSLGNGDAATAAALTAYHGKARQMAQVKVSAKDKTGKQAWEITVAPADESTVAGRRVGEPQDR